MNSESTSTRLTPADLKRVLERADCLHDPAAVQEAVSRMAVEINRDFSDRIPLVLVVMNGGLIPAGWLLPKFEFLFELDYLHATRYRGNILGKDLQWRATPHADMQDRPVLLIDDILDEGITLQMIIDECRSRGASAVRTAVLTRKLHDRNNDVTPDYVGLEVEDRYVFGCGMDYKDYFRNLTAIYAVSE